MLRESTSPIMLKFGLEMDFGMIQKSDAAIFVILILPNFSGGESPKIYNLDQNLDFDPLTNHKNTFADFSLYLPKLMSQKLMFLFLCLEMLFIRKVRIL